MLERLLRRDGVEDDPEHDRVVEEGEDVLAIGPRFSGGVRRSERSAATAVKSKYVHHSVATPASATTTEIANVRFRSRPEVPMPIATIDSPRAMITISAKRSAKCEADTRQPPALATERVPTTSIAIETLQTQARKSLSTNPPTRATSAAVRNQGASRRVARSSCGSWRRSPAEERGLQHTDDEVRDGEPRGFVLVRVGHGQRHEQGAGHRSEHDQARDDALDVDCVREPRVGRPRPPDHRKDERGSRETGDGGVFEDECRDLREREDEDEVEEELEVAGLSLLLLER